MKRILLIASTLAFLSCDPPLTTGRVITKMYEEKRVYTHNMPSTIMSGKVMTTIMIPYIITDNEDFILVVEGMREGKHVITNVYVSESCFKSYNTGDTWVIDTKCSFTDNNNIQQRQ